MSIQNEPSGLPAADPKGAGHGRGCTCGSTHPVDVLAQEHQTILSVLAVVAKDVDALRNGAPVRKAFWASVLEFLEFYADRCHHAKEEELLFVELERAGLPQGNGPTACMRQEHAMGRQCRLRMVEALRDGQARSLSLAAEEYGTLLRQHIAKEDGVLFAMAKSMLDHAAVARIRKGFARVEHDEMGAGTHCRYEEMARGLVAGDASPC